MPSASIHCDTVHFRRKPFFKKKNRSSGKEAFPHYFICSLGSVAQSPFFLRGQCTNKTQDCASDLHPCTSTPSLQHLFRSMWLVPTAGCYSSLQHPFLHQDMSFRTALQRTGPWVKYHPILFIVQTECCGDSRHFHLFIPLQWYHLRLYRKTEKPDGSNFIPFWSLHRALRELGLAVEAQAVGKVIMNVESWSEQDAHAHCLPVSRLSPEQRTSLEIEYLKTQRLGITVGVRRGD